MSKIKQLLRQFCRFGLVGLLCFTIDYGLLILMTESGLYTYFIASAISYTVSVIVNYILSMRFVFTGKEDMHKLVELIIFLILSMVGLGLTQLIMWITVEYLHLFYASAKILASLIVTIYNFFSGAGLLTDLRSQIVQAKVINNNSIIFFISVFYYR